MDVELEPTISWIIIRLLRLLDQIITNRHSHFLTFLHLTIYIVTLDRKMCLVHPEVVHPSMSKAIEHCHPLLFRWTDEPT